MKRLVTWINEAQNKRFRKRVESLETTPHKHLKRLVLVDMGEEDPYKAHIVRTQVIFGYLVYSLIAVTIVLLGA